jgi:hypothetical protein
VRFLLIPLAYALPALQAYLDAHPDGRSPLTAEELKALARLAQRVIRTGELLVRYAVALSGRSGLN